jgi:hypothetical protein
MTFWRRQIGKRWRRRRERKDAPVVVRAVAVAAVR